MIDTHIYQVVSPSGYRSSWRTKEQAFALAEQLTVQARQCGAASATYIVHYRDGSVVAVYGHDEHTIRQIGDKWFWADEVWEWHGAWETREEAQARQALYAADLQGAINVVLPQDWESRRRNCACTCATPWNCQGCDGTCVCHIESDVNHD